MEIKLCLLIAEVIITLSVLCIGFNSAQEWGYIEGTDTPDKWAKLKDSFCDGWQQSPIDIETKSVVYFPSLKPPMVQQAKPFSGRVEIANDGHKVSASFPKDPKQKILFGLDNSTDLCAYHIHWHWGSKDNQGSEHTVNGEASPIEGHIVTYDCKKFPSITEAMSKPGGLAVFGFFYEITEDKSKASPVLTSVTDVLKKSNMIQADSYDAAKKDEIAMFDMSKLLPDKLYDFYRYMGSLTTPYCTENVLWTVFKNKAYITRDQLNIFRSLKYPKPSSKPLVDNFRPVQPLNPTRSRMAYRVVAASFNSGDRITAGNIYMMLIALSIGVKSLY